LIPPPDRVPFFNMPIALSDPEKTVLEDQLIPAFRAILAAGPLPGDPAELEQLAATLLVPLELPGMPPEVATAFVGEVERHGDAGAAGILAALAVLASGEVAASARASAERLARSGVTSPAADRVGAASVREARCVAADDAELLIALLGRPRTRRLQVAILGIEREETGGALVECRLTSPLPAAEARALLETTADDAPYAERIAVDGLAARAVSAAQRAKDIDASLDYEAAIALPIIARALTGDPAGLARPQTAPPWEEDDPELIVDAADDEEGFHKLIQRLLDELEQWAKATCPADGPVWRNGDFVGSAMLEWKGNYGDGCLGRWTSDDLAEFLLDYFPRKVSVHEETLDDVVDCVIAFLGFLDQRQSLSGEPLDGLEQACDALRDDFRARTADPSSWGLAKSMVMRMFAEGIDPSDPNAFERWMTSFNERPKAEREAIIGGPTNRILAQFQSPTAGPRAKGPAQQARRKSERAARKRNRRSR